MSGRRDSCLTSQYCIVIAAGLWSNACAVKERPEEKAKAKRAIIILYAVMIICGLLPFLLYWLNQRK